VKSIAILLGTILIAILALAVGGGLMVLLAYGVGWAIRLVLDIEPFQATLLGLAGILLFMVLVDRVVRALTPLSPPVNNFDFEDDYDEDDDEDDGIEDYEIFEDEEALDKMYAGIPRWRRPNKTLDFSNVNANDRCPCGSGRKYKNCHGAKQIKI
jgi:hypothetical protein